MRAKATTREDGGVEYSDFWGYEVLMLELLADIHNFRSLTKNIIGLLFQIITLVLSMIHRRTGSGERWKLQVKLFRSLNTFLLVLQR